MRRTTRNIYCDHCYKKDGSEVTGQSMALVVGTRKTKADLCEAHMGEVIAVLQGKMVPSRIGRPRKVAVQARKKPGPKPRAKAKV